MIPSEINLRSSTTMSITLFTRLCKRASREKKQCCVAVGCTTGNTKEDSAEAWIVKKRSTVAGGKTGIEIATKQQKTQYRLGV